MISPNGGKSLCGLLNCFSKTAFEPAINGMVTLSFLSDFNRCLLWIHGLREWNLYLYLVLHILCKGWCMSESWRVPSALGLACFMKRGTLRVQFNIQPTSDRTIKPYRLWTCMVVYGGQVPSIINQRVLIWTYRCLIGPPCWQIGI